MLNLSWHDLLRLYINKLFEFSPFLSNILLMFFIKVRIFSYDKNQLLIKKSSRISHNFQSPNSTLVSLKWIVKIIQLYNSIYWLNILLSIKWLFLISSEGRYTFFFLSNWRFSIKLWVFLYDFNDFLLQIIKFYKIIQ